MGHIINPILSRLNYNKFWTSSWSSSLNFNYSYLCLQDFALLKFFFWFFHLRLFFKGNIFFSHFKIYRFFNKLHFVFFFNKILLKKVFFSNSIYDKKTFSLFFFKKLLKKNKEKLNSSLFFFNNFLKKNKELNFFHFFSFFLYLRFYIFKIKSFIIFKYLLKKNLSYFFLKNSSFLISFSFIFSSSFGFSSKSLSSFLKFKFSNKHFILGNVMRPLISLLKENSMLLGFKIKVKGRFSKRQRASVSWFKNGPVPLNNFFLPVDYSYNSFKTKYGLFSVKIYFLFKKSDETFFFNERLFSLNYFIFFSKI